MQLVARRPLFYKINKLINIKQNEPSAYVQKNSTAVVYGGGNGCGLFV